MSRALRQTFVVDGRAFEAELHLSDGHLRGSVAEGEASLDLDIAARRLTGPCVRLDAPDHIVRATVLRDGDTAWVCIDGRTYEVSIEEPGAGSAHHAGEDDFAISPMTGVVVKVSVAAGDPVEQGAELFVVEAMKMEYVVRASRAARIAEVRHAAGDSVDQGRVVVAFEETDA